MMVAFWVWAVLTWLDGMTTHDSRLLLLSSVLIGCAELTKYFGVCLVTLLFSYSIFKCRRIGIWCWFLVVPLLILVGYQFWTQELYGHGMLSGAVQFAPHRVLGTIRLAPIYVLTTASFVGGCALSLLFLAPLMWSLRQIMVLTTVELSVAEAVLVLFKGRLEAMRMGTVLLQNSQTSGLVLLLFIGVGISLIWLAIADFRTKKNAEALLLGLWVVGTFALQPSSTGQSMRGLSCRWFPPQAFSLRDDRQIRWRGLSASLLAISGLISFWVARADADLANCARTAATVPHSELSPRLEAIRFQGALGFPVLRAADGIPSF
jgi:hypothetical protein